MIKCSLERMSEKIHTFSKFGDAGHGGITRYSLSDDAIKARDYFKERMEKIGAIVTTDDMANMYATLPGTEPGLKKIVTGSHCDSVKNGGNYDGILGVIGAMEVLETIVAEKIPHRHDIVAMIWTNEEGSLYPPAMMSSGVVCNDYLPPEIAKNFKYENMMNSVSVEDGSTTFGSKLENFKYKGDRKNRLNPEEYMCDFELHIEQGPILEDEGKTIGVVDCVLGMFNYRINFSGQAAHAGTFPMHKRRDALYAASQALIYLHDEIDKLGRPELVYTTGEIVCHPCVHTVIPDFVEFSLDVRHEDPKVLEAVREIVKKLPTMEWAGCKCEIKLAWERDTVYWNKTLVDFVQQSADEIGVANMPIHSGAGHDAQFVAYMMPTTMIFVVSKDGLSHCEPEFSSDEQCTEGASVLLNAILKADKLDDIEK
ncbi:Zn-dependent hydrolase [Peptostreptococcus porci]|uniref:Zn-dependent hydrolase n=1 Tax=Peptostreptococcus porci TaxID=2652282 RepID=UPI002A757C9D|nr:Zn-dependent hydrolase [Peptostreptococcus porci]MDY2794279.1 Zn-dependent hydrolase [Peptostreptococcus porci]MDY5436201.1 Zn-dependent hydrolase [Peptostreptococcus porci]MDY5479809.1 Zn-dependent hydrolase [Peptostreptococcus porci]